MLEKLKKFLRILINTLLLKEPVIGRVPASMMGTRRLLLMLLHLAPPYWYVSKFLLMRAHTNNSPRLAAMVESGFYHMALRLITPEERRAISAACCRLVPDLSGTPGECVMLEEGYARLGRLVPETDCASVVDYLKSEKGYLSQVPMQGNGKLYSYDEAQALIGKYGRYFSYAPGTSLAHPVISALKEHPEILRLVRKNLGAKAVLNSVNTFIVFPGQQVDHYVMRVHRDYDDFNFLAFFVYWTPVAADNGATMYMPKTHVSSDSALMQRKVFMEGSPGEVFAMDGFGLHSGNSSVKTPRFVTWIRYGLANNLAVADGWPVRDVERLMRQGGG